MSAVTEDTTTELEALCELLDDELERQYSVLENVRAQGLAARAQDIPELDKRTAALSILMHESFRSEQERLRLLKPVVENYGLRGADQTLSNLINVVPEPWSARLHEFQSSLKRVVSESRGLIQANAGHMRNAMRQVDGAVDALFGAAPPQQYAADGGDTPRDRAASVLDASG